MAALSRAPSCRRHRDGIRQLALTRRPPPPRAQVAFGAKVGVAPDFPRLRRKVRTGALGALRATAAAADAFVGEDALSDVDEKVWATMENDVAPPMESLGAVAGALRSGGPVNARVNAIGKPNEFLCAIFRCVAERAERRSRLSGTDEAPPAAAASTTPGSPPPRTWCESAGPRGPRGADTFPPSTSTLPSQALTYTMLDKGLQLGAGGDRRVSGESILTNIVDLEGKLEAYIQLVRDRTALS